MMNGMDAVGTISFPKVHMNVLVRHLLALMMIRSLIHCGDIFRQSTAELSSSITFVHYTQSPRERQITRGEPRQCVSRHSGGSGPGGLALCFDGKGSPCLNLSCLQYIYRESKGRTSRSIRTIRSRMMTPFAESSLRSLQRWVNNIRSIFSEQPGIDAPFIDPSLSDLVERILPLATYYTGITSFIEMRSHLEYGLVNHALCASIRDMLKVCPETVC